MGSPPPEKLRDPSATQLGGVVVDRAAEVPIGVQLAWALRSRISSGELAPGQRLPPLRDLAEATGVNVNTVRAVYQRLEQQGLIDSQQGSGTFVADEPRRSSAVGTIAASAAREALETGVDPREVAAALYVSIDSPASGGEAERRQLLRAQIAALERALSEIEATHPGLVAPARTGRAGIGPTLLGAAELEQVRTQLVRRLSSVQAAIDAEAAEHAVGETQPTRRARRSRAPGQAERASATPESNPPAPPAPLPKPRARPRTVTRPAPAGT